MNTTTVDPCKPRAGRREWTALAVLMLPLLLVSMDVSVLYFAVPFIARDLEPTATQQLWMFDIYGFVLAGLLLTMGVVGDRIGRRRLLLIGAVAFGAASVLAAYSTSAEMLIAARAVMGVGGATLMPSTLALLRNLFLDDKQRATAIAVWTAVTGAGVAVGPVLSGILLEHFWWGSVFLINLPAMVMLLVFVPVLVPEFPVDKARRFDLLGAALSLAAVLPIVYGVKQVAAESSSTLDYLAILVGAAAGLAFVRRLRTAAHPMLDVRLFADIGFRSSLVANLVAMFGLVGQAVFTTQYLQSVLGMSPLRAALWSLAPTVVVMAAAPVAVYLAGRVGALLVAAGSFAVAAVGFLVLTQVGDDSLVLVLVGATVLAAGLICVMTVSADTAMRTVDPAAGRLGLRGAGDVERARGRVRDGPAGQRWRLGLPHRDRRSHGCSGGREPAGHRDPGRRPCCGCEAAGRVGRRVDGCGQDGVRRRDPRGGRCWRRTHAGGCGHRRSREGPGSRMTQVSGTARPTRRWRRTSPASRCTARCRCPARPASRRRSRCSRSARHRRRAG